MHHILSVIRSFYKIDQPVSLLAILILLSRCIVYSEFGENCFHLVVDHIKLRRVWNALECLIGCCAQVDSMRGLVLLVKCRGSDVMRRAN